MQRKLYKQIGFMLFLFYLVCPLFSQQSKKITWGMYGGWSWGTGYTFRWHYYGSHSDRYTLRNHLGGYFQLNLSPSFGLQLDANYQSGLYKWTLQHPSFPHEAGEERFDFVSLCLNGIYNLPKWGKLQLYFKAGGGINSGEGWSFDGIYYNLTAGPGIKLYFGRLNSGMALNLGSSFVYLFDLEDYGSNDAFYIRLNFGIEF